MRVKCGLSQDEGKQTKVTSSLLPDRFGSIFGHHLFRQWFFKIIFISEVGGKEK